MKKEVEYCLMVIENAKTRGNTSCQVPIFAKPETIEHLDLMLKMVDPEYVVRQVGFDPTEPYSYVYIKFA